MTERFYSPVIKYTTSTLKTLPGALLCFYETGTSTPKTTWSDPERDTASAHPVVALADGTFPPIFINGIYRVELKNAAGTTQPGWPVDDVGAPAAGFPFQSWSSTYSYSEDDLAVYDGEFYQSLDDDNVGNTPSTSPLFWQKKLFLDAPTAESYLNGNSDGTYTWRTIAQTKSDLSLPTDTVSDLALKAPIASPTFTGTPTVPTAAANTNTTQAASTAYVQTELLDRVQFVDSIADLTALTGFAEYQQIETTGYYFPGDGGGAAYIIRETADVTPITYVDHTMSGGFTAMLKKRDRLTVEQCGVLQSDATKSANFRAAVEAGKIIYALGANYTLDYYAAITGVDACLRITAGKTLHMGGSTVITSTTSTETRAAVIGVWRDDDNVTIIGGTLVGDRDTYVGATSESRHGIWVGEADNLNVYGTKVSDCHGDGYYISGWPNNPTVAPSTKIYLHNVEAENNYRNNMSLTFVDGFDISATLKNANGTSPEAGLDIEPNANQYVKNGKIHVTSEDNDVDGILIYGEAASTEISNVTITGTSRNNGGSGLGMSGLSGFNVNDLTVDITTHGNTGNGAKFLYLKDSKLSIQSYSNSITTQGDIRLNGCDGVSLHDWSSVSTTAVAALEIRDSDRITASNNLRSDCRSGVTVATIYVYSGSTNVTLEGVNVTGSNTIGINADSSTSLVNILGGTVNDCSLTTTATSNAINIRSAKGTVNGVSIDQPGTANATNYGISMGDYICATGNLISGYTTAYQSVGAGNVYSGFNVTVP